MGADLCVKYHCTVVPYVLTCVFDVCVWVCVDVYVGVRVGVLTCMC